MGSSWYSLCCKIQLAALPALSERHRDVVAIQIRALVIIVGDNDQDDFNPPPLIIQFVPTTTLGLGNLPRVTAHGNQNRQILGLEAWRWCNDQTTLNFTIVYSVGTSPQQAMDELVNNACSFFSHC
jgi:hypothetical protein